jgi:hypothetical protein
LSDRDLSDLSSNHDPSAHADPDDISARQDLIGVAWLVIGVEPSAADSRIRRSRSKLRSHVQ